MLVGLQEVGMLLEDLLLQRCIHHLDARHHPLHKTIDHLSTVPCRVLHLFADAHFELIDHVEKRILILYLVSKLGQHRLYLQACVINFFTHFVVFPNLGLQLLLKLELL